MTCKVTISALAYADDVALTCDTKPEASRAVSAFRLGFRKDGDKEVSQPKTEAMRVAWQLAVAASTEAEYSAALEHECEFCGKAFERESSRHQHQTGHCPTDGKPWCPLAHREQTEEALEVELILDVRGARRAGAGPALLPREVAGLARASTATRWRSRPGRRRRT